MQRAERLPGGNTVESNAAGIVACDDYLAGHPHILLGVARAVLLRSWVLVLVGVRDAVSRFAPLTTTLKVIGLRALALVEVMQSSTLPAILR